MKKWRKICLFIFFTLFFASFLLKKEKSSPQTCQKNLPFLLPKENHLESQVLFFKKQFLIANLPSVQIFPKNLLSLKEEKRREILEYKVEEGETIESIAQKFSLSPETIIWANNLNKNAKLKVGQSLIILPVDGVLHQVKKGETLFEIAKVYRAKVEDIIIWNELEGEEIFPNDILIIPGGKMPQKREFSIILTPISSSYFICPLPPCRITQSLHWYNAVDFSTGKCGEYVLAAAEGKVVSVKYGWNQGAGNTVKIQHPNGVLTQYGHLKEIFVRIGDEVFRGQPIGTVGGIPGTFGAGISTGCHLHFGVIGAKNPFAR